MDPILKVTNLSKAFTGVQALDDVSFTCNKGEIHVLIGENGAGKSTLLKIISGLYRADSGDILFKGRKVDFKHPIEARKAGIATVYQELTVLPYLTVAQNMFLNEEHLVHENGKRRILTDEKRMREKVCEIAGSYGIEIDPYALIKDLTIAKQQTVEILKMLVSDPELIILDEPTSALGREEVDKLLKIVQNLQNAGKSIIFISHRMEEVFRFGERATVFKDGKFVSTVNLSDVTADDLVRLMVGRDLKDIFPPKSEAMGDEILFEAKNINLKDKLHDVDIHVKKGEIVSLAGLQGQGQTELLRVLAGIIDNASGDIFVAGHRVHIKTPSKAILTGIAYIPEDRKVQGLFLGLSVRENLSAGSLYMRQKFSAINRSEENEMVRQNIDLLNIKTPGPEQYVVNLSGGNQQKVVLGKGLAIKPKILLFNEPTRGIDVEAKQEVYRLIRKFADEGIAVVMYSSDLMEVVGLSNRVLTMYEGRITAEMTGNAITEENIMRGSVGITSQGDIA
jgi:ABC-type sugar transport system ATPase subunit